MAPKLFLPLYVILYHIAISSLASSSGKLALFLDGDCFQASTINPTISLAVDTCLVIPGADSVSVEILPACASGDATIITYVDTSCANVQESYEFNSDCYYNFGLVPALIFACDKVAGGAAPTATSTVSAGSSSLPVAAETGTISPSDQTTPASNDAATTPTLSSSSSSSSTDSSQSTTNSGSGGSDSTGQGLNHTGQITLGVVLPIATVVIALLAWWFPFRARSQRNRADEYNMMQHPSQALVPYHPGTSPSPGSFGHHHQGSGYFGGQGQAGRSW